MALIANHLTPTYKATIAKGTNAMRWQRAEYVNLLPPCNNACPAGLNIQAWLGLARAGRYEEAWRQYMEDNPLPATHGRACYHPCEGACNRQFRDPAVAIHALDRYLGDLALEMGWTIGRRADGKTRPGRRWWAGRLVLRLPSASAWSRGRDPRQRRGARRMMRYGMPAYRLPREGRMMLVSCALWAGGIFIFAVERTHLWRRMPIDQYAVDFGGGLCSGWIR
jgi:Dihydroprymidine dehydrogenase domain II, 4Fe-4S cluster